MQLWFVQVLTCVLTFEFGFSGVHAREVRASKVEEPSLALHTRAEDVNPSPDDDPDWGAPPIIGDYDPDNAVIWDGNSRIPNWVSNCIAILWVTMVSSLPLLIIKLEGDKITQSQLTLFVVMWCAFLGGIWLFTQIILFQSVHFQQIRSLTIVEAVYFLSQILTTVGYGDITPAKPRGQVFVGLYVLFSLFVIATVLSESSELVSNRSKKYLEKVEKAAEQAMARLRSIKRNDPEASSRDVEVFKSAPPKLEYDHLVKTTLVYFVMVLAGVVFFTQFPGEGKTIFQAIYMSIITLSTVGFGAFTPVTETGLVFGAFWMLFGSMALIGVVGSFTQLQEQIKARERWMPSMVHEQQQAFLTALPAEPDMFSFLQQYILQKELCSSAEVAAVETFCKRLGQDSTGAIDKEALKTAWAS